jgi:hypothetical protein
MTGPLDQDCLLALSTFYVPWLLLATRGIAAQGLCKYLASIVRCHVIPPQVRKIAVIEFYYNNQSVVCHKMKWINKNVEIHTDAQYIKTKYYWGKATINFDRSVGMLQHGKQ